MIRAVCDTNVLASGFTIGDSIPGRLLRLWLMNEWELVVGEAIMLELERTLCKPYFQERLSAPRRTAILDLLRRRAKHSSPTVQVSGVATHPEDDIILAIAASADAGYLVTGDTKLRTQVPSYGATQLITPREFLELLVTHR